MFRNSMIPLVLVCFFFFWKVESQAKIAPALYTFGDSTVVSWNDVVLNTPGKANYPPYGIDFPTRPNARVTNGATISDFFAQWLGIQSPPSFLSISPKTSKFSEGFNYASGSAGIRSETGTADPGVVNLSMEKQIELFRKTVQEYLPRLFTKEAELRNHLSKSIFLVVVGSNDYSLNYLSSQYNTSRIFNMVQFADSLVYYLQTQLQDLFSLGARKFVVFEIEPVGCKPAFLQTVNSKAQCAEKVNSYIASYNHKLGVMVQSMRLRNTTFVLAKRYQFMNDLMANPTRYGLKDSVNPCCAVLKSGMCIPNKAPCQDRKSHVFFDANHPTEVVYKTIAEQCFKGTDQCVPINIQELAKK
ncbi:GDSL esterase/lipase 7-like [Carya illinoinensis]|uniref:GDSL esterase/lipase n=1 Tax=Carya illinoinensis TaxID=32201 RepID=A0A8T1NS99_CARIL|nr:GDSL esterase/lipase 7-like [Carya illinoinensis]KAG6635006.1 hypothetical protein CIPAW_11G012300 [Carya illinoinensis]